MSNKVAFNVKNTSHRERAKEFFKNNAWGPEGCPFEFDTEVIVPIEISRQLLAHYLKIEKVSLL